MWIYRANKNLGTLSGEQMRFTPGWSVGWYFIPIANLYKPYQAMKEIWRVSHKNKPAGYALVRWGWCLFIVSDLLARIALDAFLRADNVDNYLESFVTDIICNGFDVILNIVALMLVTRIGAAYSKNIIEPTAAPEGYITGAQVLT
jgi:hypothetical protein